MKKLTIFLGLLGFIFPVKAQQESEYYGRVGINTNTPQVTLDIVGRPTDPNAVDGVLVPRISLKELATKKNYGEKEIGTFLYVKDVKGNEIADRKHQLIFEDGFIWWTGSWWEPFGNNTIVLGRSHQGVLLSEEEPKIDERFASESIIGAMYMNPKTNTLYIWNGSQWIKGKAN